MQMKIIIVKHAEERMQIYDVPEDLVINTIQNPDNIAEDLHGKKDLPEETEWLYTQSHS